MLTLDIEPILFFGVAIVLTFAIAIIAGIAAAIIYDWLRQIGLLPPVITTPLCLVIVVILCVLTVAIAWLSGLVELVEQRMTGTPLAGAPATSVDLDWTETPAPPRPSSTPHIPSPTPQPSSTTGPTTRPSATITPRPTATRLPTATRTPTPRPTNTPVPCTLTTADIDRLIPFNPQDIGLASSFQYNSQTSHILSLTDLVNLLKGYGLHDLASIAQQEGSSAGFTYQVGHVWNGSCGQSPGYEIGISVILFPDSRGAQTYMMSRAIQNGQRAIGMFTDFQIGADSVLATGYSSDPTCGNIILYNKSITHSRFIIATLVRTLPQNNRDGVVAFLDQTNARIVQLLDAAACR